MQSAPVVPFDVPTDYVDEAQRFFVELLRIDTTNPPGNEQRAADRCAAWLREVGLEPESFDAAAGRRNLACQVGPEGRNDDALVLSAHLDVVPAAPERWTHPPFGGVEADGCIWGRGAVDMKHMAAFGLALLRAAARGELALRRPVRLVLFADEEAGCALGSLAVARERPAWLRGFVGLTEVGGFTTHMGGRCIAPVQVAEKGFVWLRLRVRGEAGHGSMPHDGGAVSKLADIVRQIDAQPFEFRVAQPVRDFLEAVAEAVGGVQGAALRALRWPPAARVVLDRLVRDPARRRPLRAMLSDTAAPTMAQAGARPNVIPGSGELVVDCRILPGTDPQAFVETFRSRIEGDYDLEVIASGPPVVQPQHPVVDVLFEVLREADPACHPVPQMITGFTDARAFEQVDTACFGFAPLWFPPELSFAAMFHGDDERVPTDGFRWGAAALWEAVRRLCA